MSRKAIDRVSAPWRARRTGKLTRNNVEALEPRVLLSAHGTNPSHGPHGPGLDHAAAREQVDAQDKGGQDSSTQDSSTQGSASGDSSEQADVQVSPGTGPVASGDQASTTGGPTLNSFGPILPYPPSDSSGQQTSEGMGEGTAPGTGPESTSPSDGESTGGRFDWGGWVYGPSEGTAGAGNATDAGASEGGADSTAGSDSVTVIDVVYVDPIPTLPGLWGQKGPNTRHPLNNGAGDGSANQSGGNTGGTQPQTQGNGSGSTGTGKTTSGNQSNPPAQGNDSEGSDTNEPQGRPQLQHGNGSPPPIYDPGNSGGSATPEVAHAPTPTPALYPMTPAKPVTPVVDTGAAVVTPLAMTPSHASGAGAVLTSSAPAPLSIAPVAGGHDSVSTGKTASEAAPGLHMTGQIAAAVPPAFSLTHVIDTTVPAAAKAVTQQIQTAGAVVAGAEAVTVQALQQSLPARVTYNFIRFDAASFQDAVAAFANELATITKPAAARHSTTRAWIITGTVLGMDAIFLGYWQLKKRKQKKARLALARAAADPLD